MVPPHTPSRRRPSRLRTFVTAAALTLCPLVGAAAAEPRFRVSAAGDHREAWDGTDEAGRTLPSGVYLARLTAGRETLTHRIALLR